MSAFFQGSSRGVPKMSALSSILYLDRYLFYNYTIWINHGEQKVDLDDKEDRSDVDHMDSVDGDSCDDNTIDLVMVSRGCVF
uniref:Uncharacterized protein n=3 Tax=Oryza TaxID=4527 RepID=Q53LC2_ORYSJ|nr:hypothetical protein LOC_Os11g14890 [Oryza sativa Japonica Group]ABA92411.1 hypothetical protein LOC_Os11g14890 [Oryza sativa Japonica Group]